MFSARSRKMHGMHAPTDRRLKPPESLTTWFFEDGTFVPMAKLVDGRAYSIITDHLGMPSDLYDE